MRTSHLFILAALSLGATPLVAGCYAETVETAPPPNDGYEPQYYDGYVVYYDDGGRPFYYVNGGVVWVPESAPVYVGLREHWRVHRDAYVRWHGRYGARYRTYRHR